MVARWEGRREEERKRGGDSEVQTASNKYSHKDVQCSIGHTVNNNVITIITKHGTTKGN